MSDVDPVTSLLNAMADADIPEHQIDWNVVGERRQMVSAAVTVNRCECGWWDYGDGFTTCPDCGKELPTVNLP